MQGHPGLCAYEGRGRSAAGCVLGDASSWERPHGAWAKPPSTLFVFSASFEQMFALLGVALPCLRGLCSCGLLACFLAQVDRPHPLEDPLGVRGHTCLWPDPELNRDPFPDAVSLEECENPCLERTGKPHLGGKVEKGAETGCHQIAECLKIGWSTEACPAPCSEPQCRDSAGVRWSLGALTQADPSSNQVPSELSAKPPLGCQQSP